MQFDLPGPFWISSREFDNFPMRASCADGKIHGFQESGDTLWKGKEPIGIIGGLEENP